MLNTKGNLGQSCMNEFIELVFYAIESCTARMNNVRWGKQKKKEKEERDKYYKS